MALFRAGGLSFTGSLLLYVLPQNLALFGKEKRLRKFPSGAAAFPNLIQRRLTTESHRSSHRVAIHELHVNLDRKSFPVEVHLNSADTFGDLRAG